MTTPKCFLNAHYVTCWLAITIEHRTSPNLGENCGAFEILYVVIWINFYFKCSYIEGRHEAA